MTLRNNTVPLPLRDAVKQLLDHFAHNAWFVETYWPENVERVVMMITDVMSKCPPASSSHIFDVGCGNGYISYLFSILGYEVTATDAWELPERDQLFQKNSVQFFYSNFNEPTPFSGIQGEPFDVVLFGEVIEHILNHPQGLLSSMADVLKTNGMLVLTTPNPATIMNALRVLQGRHTLWGTQAFIEEKKIDNGRIICAGDIHYREYLTFELCNMLQSAEFTSMRSDFLDTV